MPRRTPGRPTQSDFDRCRANVHLWYDTDADRPPPFGYYMWWLCDSCGTIRKDIVDRRGQLLSRNYDYPDGYKDTEHFTKSDYRLRYLARRITPGVPPPGAAPEWRADRDTPTPEPVASNGRLRGRPLQVSTPSLGKLTRVG